MKKTYHLIKSKIVKNQLIVDSFWSLGGNVIGKGLALLAGILVARFLGKDIYGEYGIIRNTILTMGVFSTFGLGYTATKYVAGYRKNKPEYIKLFVRYATKITLVFSGIMALLLFIFAKSVAVKMFDAEHLTVPLRFLAVLIVFNAITTTQIGILAGFGSFNVLAKINAAVGVLTFLLSVLLTYFWHFEGALLALLIAQIANCILNFYAVRQNLPKNIVSVTKDKQLQTEILKFSTPIALQEAIFASISWLGGVLLVQYTTFGELGMYTAAMQWNAIVLFVPGMLQNVVLSHLSINLTDISAHNKILKMTIVINILSTAVPAIIIALFSGFIQDFYGDTFLGLSSLVSIVVFMAIFASVSNVYVQAYMSKGYNWLMLGMRTMKDIGIVVLFLIFLHFSNLGGAKALIYSNFILSSIFCILIIIVYKYLTAKKI